MTGLPIFQVDAFTDRPFKGNPAAVCFLDEPRQDTWMQDVAREMNLSETAFLLRQEDGYSLRWFTPACEVDLCGHATLASSHALWEEKRLKPDQEARFYTRSGWLFAHRRGDWIELDFPLRPEKPAPAPAGLAAALGVEPKYVGRSLEDYLVELESEKQVREMKPDFPSLAGISSRGIIVTSRSQSTDCDFVSRFFAPALGINEDPVTGSAHCTLAPFWAERLGKKEMTGYQASSRGGFVRVRLAENRVYISGQAVTVLRGNLLEK
ncbi:MAG TPA: PhzF family phenazine biosynthesis protein [archaeon]|nr:PhzF family phenazine biosynthesis protein [archaeon]